MEAPGFVAGALQALLGWATLARDPAAAAALVARGVALARDAQSQRGLTDGLRIQALVAMRRGRWQDAERALEEAVRVVRAMPYPYGEAKALYVYALLHQARGEPEPARARFEEALAILTRLGERLYAEPIERALTQIAPR